VVGGVATEAGGGSGGGCAADRGGCKAGAAKAPKPPEFAAGAGGADGGGALKFANALPAGPAGGGGGAPPKLANEPLGCGGGAAGTGWAVAAGAAEPPKLAKPPPWSPKLVSNPAVVGAGAARGASNPPNKSTEGVGATAAAAGLDFSTALRLLLLVGVLVVGCGGGGGGAFGSRNHFRCTYFLSNHVLMALLSLPLGSGGSLAASYLPSHTSLCRMLPPLHSCLTSSAVNSDIEIPLILLL